MKRALPILFVVFFFTLCGCKTQKPVDQMSDDEKVHLTVTGENGLSDADVERQHELRANILERLNEGNKATDALEKALDDAREMLPDYAVEQLNAAQKQWETQGRGKAMNALVEAGADTKSAFTISAFMRADKVREQTTRAILVDSSDGFQGYFRTLQGQSIEIFVMNGETVNATIRSESPEFILTVHGSAGTAQDGVLTLVSENDTSVSVNLRLIDDNLLEVTPTAEFSASRLSDYATAVTAQFRRIKKGDINVFSF